MSIHKFGFAALAVVLMASLAQAQHTDIEIEVEAGMLATDPRVGEGEFGEAPNPANVADEPGIEADDGVLMPGDVIGFNAVDILGSNLWYWDGTGPVNFGASPTNLTIEHPVTNATAVLDSADSGGVGGFTIGAADALGGLHQDLDFVLGNMTPTGRHLPVRYGIDFAKLRYVGAHFTWSWDRALASQNSTQPSIG